MRGLPSNLNVFNKYTSGLGGGLGGGIGGGGSGIGGSNPYAYNDNRQGEQGSIGTSGSGQNKPGSNGGSFVLPSVTNPGGNLGALKSRG